MVKKLPLGIAMLTELNQQATAITDSLAVITTMRKPDGAVSRTWTALNFGAGAGNSTDLKTIRDVGALLQSLDATQDDKNLVIDLAYQVFQMSSADAFHFVPMLVLCENGETIVEQNANVSDPSVSLDTGLTGVFSVKFGPLKIGRQIRENGADYWLSSITHDITAECRKYTKQMIRDQLNEVSIRELFSAGQTVTEGTDKTVYCNELFVLHYHLEETKIINL